MGVCVAWDGLGSGQPKVCQLQRLHGVFKKFCSLPICGHLGCLSIDDQKILRLDVAVAYHSVMQVLRAKKFIWMCKVG